MSVSFRSALILGTTLVWLGVGLGAAVAQQTIQPAGPATTTGGAPNGSLNDVAFDETNGVYLHVYHGGIDVWGRFVRTDGATVGEPFRISLSRQAFAGWPRVGYATGGTSGLFLVTYSSDVLTYDRSKNIIGQFVRFGGAGGELVGPWFYISEASTNAGVAQEAGGIAYNSLTDQFLVTWSDSRAGWEAYARLIRTDRSAATGDINVSAAGGDQGQPNAAYDWKTDRFLVVYTGDHPTIARSLGTFAKVLDGAGQQVTGAIELNRGGYQDAPNVTYLPEPGLFLTFWRDQQGPEYTADIVGRKVGWDGSTQSIQPLLATNVYDGNPDGDYSWVNRRVMVTGMHDSGYIWAGELDGNGDAKASFRGSNVPPGNGGGSYWPRVAASNDGQFGVSYMLNYSTAIVERWQAAAAPTPGPRNGGGTPPPPPPPPITPIDLAGAPNGSWFFAEGVATNDALGFDTQYIFVNESDDAVSVRGYFAKDGGDTYEKTFSLSARSRKTISLKKEVGVGSFSAVLQSMTPSRQIFASRSVTWGAGGYGSTSEVATGTRSRTWYFAEGSRNHEYFQNFFLLFNPGQVDANVTFTFYKPDGTTPTVTAVVKPQSRFTLWANTVAALVRSDFSVRIDADQEIVAERAMYWGRDFEGGHDSLGTTTPSSSWYFAEGAAAPGFQTFYTVLNSNDSDVVVDITYFLDAALGQPPRVLSYVVPKRSRYTVHLNSQLGNVGGVAALIVSRGGQPIVAERSIYWGRSQWVEGTNVVGATAPAMTWRLPEGSLEDKTDHFLLIANPNQFDVRVNVVLYLEDGRRFTEAKTIPAGTRVTLYARVDFTDNAVDRSLLAGQRFGVKVQSTTLGGPVFVEHAIYSDWLGADYWRAGAAAFGIPQ